MSNELQLAQVERDIAARKRDIELAESLKRLESNRDFKKIIGELYLNQEAIRLVHAKADPALQLDKHQSNIIRDIDAIGSFAGFLSTIHINGRRASEGLKDDEATRTELMNISIGVTNG
jgi:hypothetical protein